MQLFKIYNLFVVAHSLEDAIAAVKDRLPESYFSESICRVDVVAVEQSAQRTAGILRENFNPYDLNDVAKVDEIVKRRR